MTTDMQVIDQTPSVDDYIAIRVKAGLTTKNREAAARGLNDSLYCVCLVHKGVTIGFGRVVGDGGVCFDIVDIAVLPHYQGQGLGRLIMEKCMQYIDAHTDNTSWVTLVADPGKETFYEKFGFADIKNLHFTGMYYTKTGI